MANSQRGPFLRFLQGIWNTINFTRRLVVNLIFLAIVAVVLVAIFAKAPKLAERTALVIDPKGTIVEQYSTDPSQRMLASIAGGDVKEVQLRDLLRAIDKAGSDPRIERIVLVPDQMSASGLAVLRELGQALLRFRAGGKEVVVISSGMTQGQYYLAAHADQILLDPDGAVLLEGLSSYRSYFHDALEKLGVDVHLIKVGEFKSAAEPYILNQASDAAKEADLYWMGGIWDGLLAEIASLRKLDAAVMASDIHHFDQRVIAHDGDLAKLALDQKLVDQLMTRAEARALLIEKGVASEDSFRQANWVDYLDSLPAQMPSLNGQVGVVVAQGEIVPGDKSQGVVGAQATAALVRAAREDDSIKALVLRVDSPGGDVYSSELIRREVALTRDAGKPVVVSMGNVAASGGYWISMNADEIWAQPNTITGSIGIFGLFATAPDTLAKLGIHTDGVGTTPLAGAFDVRRPFNPQLEAILTSVIDKGYRDFIGKVADARGQTPEQIDGVAQGRVWSGVQAGQRGLVDKLGGLHEALAAAATRAELGEDFRVTYIERELSPWERIALDFSNNNAVVSMSGWLPAAALPLRLLPESELKQALSLLNSLQGKRYGVVAHCFCELR